MRKTEAGVADARRRVSGTPNRTGEETFRRTAFRGIPWLVVIVAGGAVAACEGDGPGGGRIDADAGADAGADDGRGGEDGGPRDAGDGDGGPRDAGGDEPPRPIFFKASNAAPEDNFGQGVAFDGDTLIVGAPNEDSDAQEVDGDQDNDRLDDAGAVYVFRREEEGWRQEAYVKAPNPGALDRFGDVVALDGDLLAVGTSLEDSGGRGPGADPFDDDAPGSGAVYLFRRGADGWTFEAFLKASNADPGDGFGIAVAIDGEVVVVGADGESSLDGTDPDDNDGASAGAAYVFRRVAGTWEEEAYLKPDVLDVDDRFGEAVDILGDTIVVGATGEDGGVGEVNGDAEDDTAESAGAAYVFRRGPEGGWSQEAYLKSSNPRFLDSFGGTVSIAGDRILVGAPLEFGSGQGVDPTDDDGTPAAGAAYVYRRGPEGWSQEAYLKASNTGSGDGFGTTCDLRGSWIACGAPGEESAGPLSAPTPEDNSISTAGAVYLFRRGEGGGGDGVWNPAGFLKPERPLELGLFGTALALTDDEAVVVGHPGDASAATGVGGDPLGFDAVEAGAVYLLPLALAAD
ncbi:MAG TPA: hypothetical protein RMF84_17835 [Polyangiaceae bacterium LLY-WYZ-14_1]|nr:hypothetical protein [Polyangiaceae bacterium LLY-WYZ-14_1]